MATGTRRGALRATAVLLGFVLLTLPLMPVQAALLRAGSPLSKRLPHWYHRQVCRLLGLKIRQKGAVVSERPVLLVANHSSWLDILVLSAIAPVSFVAKKEIASWPFAGTLARLQRSVFVDRERRASVEGTRSEIQQRLLEGDTIVLFAEGTSSDGNKVLPFKTPLFAAAKPSRADDGVHAACLQTLALAYTSLHGLPLGRANRPLVAWYGDMDLAGHVWRLLAAGPLDVAVEIGPAIPLHAFEDRKALARHAELEIRSAVAQLLHQHSGGQHSEHVAIAGGELPVGAVTISR